MTNADGVLDQIDHALHDWDTSDDAMRWTPEPVPVQPQLDPEAVRLALVRVGEVATRAMEAYRSIFTQFAAKMADLLPRMNELGRQIREMQAAERQHNLHVAYRRRQKRRSRR
jgi:hypothetical protein